MRLTLPALLSAISVVAAAAAASASTTSVVLTVPTSQHLANPGTLPPSTRATLTTLGSAAAAAPLSLANTFVFHNVTAGSYLADVHCATHGFAPLRVDVVAVPPGAGSKTDGALEVRVWETFRGNDWGNRGEEVRPSGGAGGFSVRCLGKKVFFQERGKFSVLTILKNPMILIGLVSMVIFLGMPKLIDNMDPEMRAEWEEQQKKGGPMGTLMGGAQAGGNPMGNFDMAAFLAGSGSKDEGASGSSSSNGKKGGKR
ncbi:hypothetical protein BX600DRAFT_449806 [Xylariales sp. PMI_506]|nr:hypothetical protein BX600DRAFT_449806 [Xylariales sp. PMI_506]